MFRIFHRKSDTHHNPWQFSISHHTSNHTANHSVASVPTRNIISKSEQFYNYHHTDSYETFAVHKTFKFVLQQSQNWPFRQLAEVDLLLLKPNHIPVKLVFQQYKLLRTVLLFSGENFCSLAEQPSQWIPEIRQFIVSII